MSKLILCFDTETSGLPVDARASDPRQPHLCSYSVVLMNESLEVVHEKSEIIQQVDFVCDEGALKAHGITKERSMAEGVPEKQAAELLHSFIQDASVVVAHNITFDRQIARIAMRRFGIITGESEEEGKSVPWAITGKEFCTMKTLTPVCKIPHPKGWKSFKWPTLKEACEILLNEKVQEGEFHCAIEDVRACSRLFRWCVQNGHGPKPKAQEVVA